MHARELIEVAAALALNTRLLLDESPRLCEAALAEYWTASRCRLDEWGRRLRGLANHPRVGTLEADNELEALVQEIQLSQVLTRTIAALTVAHDRRHHLSEAGAIGRNAVSGHDEAISRVRALTFAWWRASSPQAKWCRNLERRSERWTDLLLGYILPLCPAAPRQLDEIDYSVVDFSGHAVDFTFDAARAQEFAYDANSHTAGGGTDGEQRLVSSSQMLGMAIRQAFATAESEPVTGDFNRRIAGGAIGLFGPEVFDDHGTLRSTWLQRMQRTADDTCGMVEDLFQEPRTNRFQPPVRWRI